MLRFLLALVAVLLCIFLDMTTVGWIVIGVLLLFIAIATIKGLPDLLIHILGIVIKWGYIAFILYLVVCVFKALS